MLPGCRPVWPVTCHLTLLWAHALRSATGWAPAGQLACLLAWSYANEKPRETFIHLNSQMGGQRGGQTNGDMVAEDLDWVVKYYWGVFTEEFGDFCVSWPEGELHLTHEKENFELQKCPFSPQLTDLSSSRVISLGCFYILKIEENFVLIIVSMRRPFYFEKKINAAGQ